jgi:hypothetical protein
LSPFDDELAPAPAETWWDYFNEHRDLAMAEQAFQWTCSVCATNWTVRATGLDPYADRISTGVGIGYPDCVDQWSGCKSTQCIVDVFESYGVGAVQEWIDWDRAVELCSSTAGVLNSTSWYHFVSIRGMSGEQLWIANSAPGYRGIWDTISRAQFESLPPWQAVTLVR